MFKTLACHIAAFGMLLWVAGCAATGSYTSNEKFDEAKIGPIGEKNISYEGVFRNPIIIVHGFLGANLIDKKTGRNVWGKFSGIDGIYLSDEELRSLAVPMELGEPLKDLNDDTVPDGMLNTVSVKLMGITFKENAYINLVKILQDGGFQPEGFPMASGRNYNTLFQFAYDWRRDLQWNAEKLDKFIKKKREYLQEQYRVMYGIKNYDVQFDLIGHSMGGLLSRYYMRYGTADLPPEGVKPKPTWYGSKYVDRVIILGTPNAGYLDTILEMRKGTEIPPFPPALLGTWPTYYQMMPAPSRKSVVYADDKQPIDMFDVSNWLKFKWGLADPKQDETLERLLPNVASAAERRKIAIDHLTKCLKRAKRFIEVMSVKSKPPPDVKLYLVMGNAVDTTRRAFVDRKTGEITKVEYAPGDGKVTVSSALYDERAGQQWRPFFSSPIAWRGMIQLRAAHMGITTDPAFKDNILFLLTAVPSADQLSQEKKQTKSD